MSNRYIVEFESNGQDVTTMLITCKKDEILEYLEKDKRLTNIKVINIKKARN